MLALNREKPIRIRNAENMYEFKKLLRVSLMFRWREELQLQGGAYLREAPASHLQVEGHIEAVEQIDTVDQGRSS
ncbi:unnamed protein product [Sphenostylis stenocarpa]|uniref:Uncharacterized protein n=1 Tax=Sphenostylis stenocarpa TaxID=92480 RepID=A0AA86VM46_9FABA|nr:unnamed protein product [Sphenostylis stenocarpa]